VNAPLRRVAVAVLALFGLLIANANYVQVFQGDKLRTDAGNTRVLLDEYERQRGSIVVEGGTIIAESRRTDDKLKYQRVYPGKDKYAPVTGFYSVIYGKSGIEQTANDLLTGSDNRLFTRRLSDLLTGRDPRGGNVVLTLQKRAQEIAYQKLAGRPGAVVALNPSTGAILALASSPSFDPNPLASHEPKVIRTAFDKYSADELDPMVNRAINERYPPGSTFKVVISAAALQAGYSPETQVPCPRTYTPPQTSRPLPNFNGETCGADQVPLITALTHSFNTAFAKLAVERLHEPAVRAQAEAFGITDEGFSVPLPVSGSQVCSRRNDPPAPGPSGCRIADDAALAQSAIGQRSVAITPLEGAMMAAAVANRGQLMRPYLVKELQAPDLSVLDRTEAEPFNKDQPQTMPQQAAEQLTRMMVNVVDNGTGRTARIDGVKVAGKTGTAQNVPGKPPHAWFIGFAPADNPRVAVAVVLENGGTTGSETTGGLAAGPIAKAVMEAVLNIREGG
jgi:peptidoglycan glycosyltransferase